MKLNFLIVLFLIKYHLYSIHTCIIMYYRYLLQKLPLTRLVFYLKMLLIEDDDDEEILIPKSKRMRKTSNIA